MKNSKQIIVLLLLAVLVLGQGCYTMRQTGTYKEVDIEMTNVQNKGTTENFTAQKKVNHFLWGLVSPSDAGYEQLVASQVTEKGGKGAVNVKTHYQMTFVDGLLGVLTLGIYRPFTLTVQGEVVK